jgi:hypothetical protein
MTKDDLPPLPKLLLAADNHYSGEGLADKVRAWGLAAIAAHDAKREKILLVRELDLHHKWHVASPVEREGTRLNGLQYAWAYIEREGA